jgi:hypothetical protein
VGRSLPSSNLRLVATVTCPGCSDLEYLELSWLCKALQPAGLPALLLNKFLQLGRKQAAAATQQQLQQHQQQQQPAQEAQQPEQAQQQQQPPLQQQPPQLTSQPPQQQQRQAAVPGGAAEQMQQVQPLGLDGAGLDGGQLPERSSVQESQAQLAFPAPAMHAGPTLHVAETSLPVVAWPQQQQHQQQLLPIAAQVQEQHQHETQQQQQQQQLRQQPQGQPNCC